MSGSESTAAEIDRVFRAQYGRAVSVLVRLCGDIDDAEEAVQDAFHAAVERWPSTGIPPNPAGWIIATARNRAIDRHRRAPLYEERGVAGVFSDRVESEPLEEDAVRDDQLRLIFTCCHPALAMNVQVALTLRLLAGLSSAPRARSATHEFRIAFPRRRSFPAACARCLPSSISSSTKDTRRAPVSVWFASSFAEKRFGWDDCCTSLSAIIRRRWDCSR